jgi:hypothetical protein
VGVEVWCAVMIWVAEYLVSSHDGGLSKQLGVINLLRFCFWDRAECACRIAGLG